MSPLLLRWPARCAPHQPSIRRLELELSRTARASVWARPATARAWHPARPGPATGFCRSGICTMKSDQNRPGAPTRPGGERNEVVHQRPCAPIPSVVGTFGCSVATVEQHPQQVSVLNSSVSGCGLQKLVAVVEPRGGGKPSGRALKTRWQLAIEAARVSGRSSSLPTVHR